jgi:hypothetical protein
MTSVHLQMMVELMQSIATLRATLTCGLMPTTDTRQPPRTKWWPHRYMLAYAPPSAARQIREYRAYHTQRGDKSAKSQ